MDKWQREKLFILVVGVIILGVAAIGELIFCIATILFYNIFLI